MVYVVYYIILFNLFIVRYTLYFIYLYIFDRISLTKILIETRIESENSAKTLFIDFSLVIFPLHTIYCIYTNTLEINRSLRKFGN